MRLMGAVEVPRVQMARGIERPVLCLAVAAAVASGACTSDQGRTLPYQIENRASVAVSVALLTGGGEEAIVSSIAPGATWRQDWGNGDCTVRGTYVARDAAGREVARRAHGCGDYWVVSDGTPVTATVVNDVRRPVSVKFSRWSGGTVVVSPDLAAGASASLDLTRLGDLDSICRGRLGAFDSGQALPIAERVVETCDDWNWAIAPARATGPRLKLDRRPSPRQDSRL